MVSVWFPEVATSDLCQLEKMTTAARPAFEPAGSGRGEGEGDLNHLLKQYSSREPLIQR